MSEPQALCGPKGESFPYNISNANVGLIDQHNLPLVCGGILESTSKALNDKCFIIGNPKPVATLLAKRLHPASMVTNEGIILWITGGQVNGSVTKSSEKVNPLAVNISIPGPDLPVPLMRHCITLRDPATAILFGEGRSWTFNFEEEHWTEGQKTLNNYEFAICGTITDLYKEDSFTILIGKGKSIFHSRLTLIATSDFRKYKVKHVCRDGVPQVES